MSDRRSGRASILLVEDDEVAATALHDGLVSLGYAVRRVASARDALATFETSAVDLVLLGLLLPDTDGLILCSNLKTRTAAPIFVVSERSREVDRLLALELGAADLLTGPVDVDALHTRIETMIVDRPRVADVRPIR
jgi:DNA-binding response OmpR family regulator